MNLSNEETELILKKRVQKNRWSPDTFRSIAEFSIPRPNVRAGIEEPETEDQVPS